MLSIAQDILEPRSNHLAARVPSPAPAWQHGRVANAGWTDANSEMFVRLGDVFVPDRDTQLDAICALVPESPNLIVELSCGEGLLAERLLERFSASRLIALDASPAMVTRAAARLAPFRNRQEVRTFEIADGAWRSEWSGVCDAVVSSLAVHHLDDPGKRRLYGDVLRMLRPGGALVIADLIQPASRAAGRLAAAEWDRAVRERSLARSGDLSAHDAFVSSGWNSFEPGNDDLTDMMSPLAHHLRWLEAAGYEGVDAVWVKAGHAVYAGWRPTG
jgi:tRNA (cmo5U34)-methyltransferase